MKQRVNFNILWNAVVLALVVLFSSALVAQVSGSAQFSKTLEHVRVHAAQARDDAALLESYSRSGLAWSMHAQCLENIREHVNDLAEDFTQLQALRSEATPGQRAAIDRIDPLLRDMAASLTATINYLNQNNHNQGAMKDPVLRSRVDSDLVKINKVYRTICECPKG